jgi:ferredoxin
LFTACSFRLSYAKFKSRINKNLIIGDILMPTINAETAQGPKTIDATAGRRLVLVLEDGGVDILHRCGGNARCTTCRVEITGGDAPEMGDTERECLTQRGALEEGFRLSCQIQVAGDLDVKVLKQLSTSEGMDDPGPRPEEWE